MSERNPIRIFVTHCFSEEPDYFRVFEYLESATNFFYLNCSRPDESPGAGKEAMKDALREQMRDAEAVVVLSGIYDKYREMMDFQLDVAGAFGKPVVALKPFGGVQDMPARVAERADEVVDWNERAIVDTIRHLARQEDTQRWDVIEFDPS